MTTAEAAVLHPNIVHFIKDAFFGAPKKTPKEVVKSLTLPQFLAAGHFFSLHNKRVQRCLKTRQKREERLEKVRIKESELGAYLRGLVTAQGVWLTEMVELGKENFGGAFCTRRKAEAMCRAMDGVTLRRMQSGQNREELAVFLGVKPQEETETCRSTT